MFKMQPRCKRGVFSKRDVSASELPMALCLYPGVYTPGIPARAAASVGDEASMHVYLANMSPPSDCGSDIRDNAYILNLSGPGGYIDGLALGGGRGGEALDCNPSACAHLVNHDAARSNVEVLSFSWPELLGASRGDSAVAVSNEDEYFRIPNEAREDGTPWYYDAALEEVVSFPKRADGRDAPRSRNSGACGAAFVLNKPISEGEELLLDYGLSEPYPPWARGWYEGAGSVPRRELRSIVG